MKTLCALLMLSFPVAALAAPAKPTIFAKPNIDARGVAALDKSIAYYEGLKSFSLTTTDVVTQPGKMQRFRSQLNLQMPLRMSLSMTDLDALDPAREPQFVGLVSANSLAVAVEREAATPLPIHSDQERANAFLRLGEPSPSLSKSVLGMTFNSNPARGSFVRAVRYGSILDGGRRLISVIVVRKYGDDSGLATLEYRLSPRNYALQKLVMRRQRNGKNALVVTTFGAATSNWKGSQRATDAAVYNWKTVAPRIVSAAARPSAVVRVEANAHAIFARAAKIYGTTNALRVAWTEDGDAGSFDFERAGYLRLESHTRVMGKEIFRALILIDGHDEWTLEESLVSKDQKLLYRRYALETSAETQAIEGLRFSSDMPRTLSVWISGINPLDAGAVENAVNSSGAREFHAQVLPAQTFAGKVCDLVRITTVALNSDIAVETKQKIYWFAHDDGRLMRYQERTSQKNKEVSASNSQITAQELNPQFTPDTFKFTPPKGAKLETN